MPTTASRGRKRVNPHALFAFRQRKKLTQAELGEPVGLHHTTVSRLEGGERYSLPIEVIDGLAAALDVPSSALYAAE